MKQAVLSKAHINDIFLTNLEMFVIHETSRGAITQLLNIILQLRILVLLVVSTLPYVVKGRGVK
jgi:hypothetical protein